MEDLQARLMRLCSDIAELEQELNKHVDPDGEPTPEICEEQALSEAKSAVDRIRHLLWPYAQAAAKHSSGLDEALQRYRMERVTTLLHDLTDRVAEPRLAALPEAHSFFASIQEIATTAVEKHLERVTRQPMSRPLHPAKRKSFLN